MDQLSLQVLDLQIIFGSWPRLGSVPDSSESAGLCCGLVWDQPGVSWMLLTTESREPEPLPISRLTVLGSGFTESTSQTLMISGQLQALFASSQLLHLSSVP